MKNYALRKEESKRFITEFRVYDDINRIVIVFGDGHNIHIDNYTQSDIDNLYEVLEEQVRNAERYEKDTKFQIKSFIRRILVLLGGTIFTSLCLTMNGYSTILVNILIGVIGLVGATKIGSRVSILRDINKHRIFLENKEEIINNLKKDSPVLMNTNKKTQEFVNQLEEPITINDLDNITQSDLNRILNNIEELNALGYVSPEREDRPYVIRPKKK